LAVRENNSCLKCGSITEVLFRNKDRVPFLRCIEGACKNMQDMNATKSSTGKRAAKNNGRNIDEGIEEEMPFPARPCTKEDFSRSQSTLDIYERNQLRGLINYCPDLEAFESLYGEELHLDGNRANHRQKRVEF
jgi:hypothetical protein